MVQNTTVFTSVERQEFQEKLRQADVSWDVELRQKEKIIYANHSEPCVENGSNVYAMAYGEGFAANVSVPGNLSLTSDDAQVLAMEFTRDGRLTENDTDYMYRALFNNSGGGLIYMEAHHALGPSYVRLKPEYQLLDSGERLWIEGLGGFLLPIGVAPLEISYCRVERPWISRELTGIKEIRLIRDDTGYGSSPYIEIDSILYGVDESVGGKRWPYVNVTCHGIGNVSATRVVISKLNKDGHADARFYKAYAEGNETVSFRIPLRSENPEYVFGFEIKSQSLSNGNPAAVGLR